MRPEPNPNSPEGGDPEGVRAASGVAERHPEVERVYLAELGAVKLDQVCQLVEQLAFLHRRQLCLCAPGRMSQAWRQGRSILINVVKSEWCVRASGCVLCGGEGGQDDVCAAVAW